VSILIRPAEPADAAAVRQVIAAAFRPVDGAVDGTRDRITDGTVDGTVAEVGLYEALRRDPAWITELCLVAVRDGWVVGQLTSSNGTLTDPAGDCRRLVGVGPVAVHPQEQGTGVGRALLTTLIDRARQAGESALVLLGDPAFYGRFGFRPAADVGVAAPDPAWGEHFMALVLQAGLPPAGSFRYAAPFDAF
jgi:putative acetyltransferase